ncbi:MAG: hypothetical protein ACD_39C01781G0001 [uncultured bacterium]|nr:MAG: hypothetical protein ACD_39C01781G0001 [uncultured bacterium]
MSCIPSNDFVLQQMQVSRITQLVLNLNKGFTGQSLSI